MKIYLQISLRQELDVCRRRCGQKLPLNIDIYLVFLQQTLRKLPSVSPPQLTYQHACISEFAKFHTCPCHAFAACIEQNQHHFAPSSFL